MTISIGQDGKTKLCVGKLPRRKRPSLYLWTPMSIKVLASFTSDRTAEQAESFIEGMVGYRLVDGGLHETP